MLLRAHFWFGLLLLLLPCAARSDDPVTIEAENCFANMAPRGGVCPVVVSLHNSGPSADGSLIVKGESYSDVLRSYAYPVSLPTGTDKQIVVYPAISADSIKIDFSFDGSARAKNVSLPQMYRDGMQIGLIGDEIGALTALRYRTPQNKSSVSGSSRPPATFTDCYAKPELAPDRAAGYQCVSTLVLSGGAERLRPEQWDAIRHWVLDGGSLILLGGAGASYLRVPDAAVLLPVTQLQDTSVSNLTLPGQGNLPPLPSGPVALVTGTLKPGTASLASQAGHVVLSRQALGAGTVLLVGFSPLEQPLRGWANRRDLWVNLIHQATATLPAWNLRQWTMQQASFTDEQYTVTRYTGGRVVPHSAQQLNPFRIKLPPLATIAWLFLAYFVLVIPVSYFVLKRLRRLEWAWVTSPVLSVAFAYAFYLFTAQLYQAGLSRRTAGVVVAAAGDPNAQFDGFSEMFFPRGGSYPISIPGAEALELSPFIAGDNSGVYYSSSPSGANQLLPLQTVDAGDVRAPDYQMGNLAFRRLYHTEPVSLGGGVTATLTRDAEGGLTGTVHNGTNLTLTGGGLWFANVISPGTRHARTYMPVGILVPGQTQMVTAKKAAVFGANTPFEDIGARTIARSDKDHAFFIGKTSGTAFGPPLGKDVGGDSSVTLIVSLPVMPAGRVP